MELEGNFKEFNSFKEALEYLRQYDYGYLNHSAMERNSFVFLKTNGRPYWYDSVTDSVEPLSKADLLDFADIDEWPAEEHGKKLWGYIPGSDTALTAGGEEWFREIRASQAMIESYCIVGTTLDGKLNLLDDLYTYSEAMDYIETFENENSGEYVGFDIFTESRYKDLIKKLDGVVQKDHMEDDLVDEITSDRQKRVDAKKVETDENQRHR